VVSPSRLTLTGPIKKFVKETTAERKNESAKVRYIARIKVPNWMPSNKVQKYKNLVTTLDVPETQTCTEEYQGGGENLDKP